MNRRPGRSASREAIEYFGCVLVDDEADLNWAKVICKLVGSADGTKVGMIEAVGALFDQEGEVDGNTF
jgi:hypothetical protein